MNRGCRFVIAVVVILAIVVGCIAVAIGASRESEGKEFDPGVEIDAAKQKLEGKPFTAIAVGLFCVFILFAVCTGAYLLVTSGPGGAPEGF